MCGRVARCVRPPAGPRAARGCLRVDADVADERRTLQAMPSVQEQADVFELLNKEATERLNRLAASGNQLDTKSALLAGIAATATQFLAIRPATNPTLAILAFTLFGGAFALALAASADHGFLQ